MVRMVAVVCEELLLVGSDCSLLTNVHTLIVKTSELTCRDDSVNFITNWKR